MIKLITLKNLTDRFSIEQIIQLEKRLVTDNFELIDFTVDDSSDEYLTGSISIKKQYEELNIDYNNLVENFKKLSEENEEINEINDKNKNQLISVAFDNQNLKESSYFTRRKNK